MPELPEVEVVTEGLRERIGPNTQILSVRFLRKDLRSPLPLNLAGQLVGQTLRHVRRRAKYIVIETDAYVVISHLGMTGQWRFETGPLLRPHDHIVIELSSGQSMIYNDTRRFGVFDVITPSAFGTDRRFSLLGPEPFDISSSYLFEISRKRTVPLKNFIMDQRIVVGVGNIYASEALYLAGLKPFVQARRLSQEGSKALTAAIQKTLKKAIQAGGSTIRDFASSGGESGYFQNQHAVYGRQGQPCRKCGTLIRSKILGGRNTFWCVKCQK